jgi:hypothetical protein
MDQTRRTSLVAGAFYLLTFISIPTLFLYSQARGANYILGAGPDTRVYVGVILEVVVALAGIGTAVALFPVVKRQNEGMALGFVATRTVEAGGIIAGAVGLLAIVGLKLAGAGPSELAASHALVGLHDWAFTLSQSLMPVMNALLLGTLLYQSRLVPRALPVLGLIGAPLLAASVVLTVTGVVDYGSGLNGLLSLPIALWELSLGVYLVAKGFRAQGLIKLGFTPDVPAPQSVPGSDTAAGELRPAA